MENDYIATGITGLDEILEGGLTPGFIYLVTGDSGAGKTMLSLQFCLEGLRNSESVLYLALSDTRKDLAMIARSHSWDLEKLHIVEPSTKLEDPSSMFHPSEVELSESIQQLKESVGRIIPKRLVVDSLTELRMMGQSTLQYRRTMQDLKLFLAERGCTVLFLDRYQEDFQRSLVHGVIRLESLAPGYGTDRRKLHVVKMAGRSYSGGYHDFNIRKGGLQVFPRIVAAEHRGGQRIDILHSGVPELDAMLGSGIRTGSCSLITGSTGSGKSNIAALFSESATQRGEKVLYFAFEERPDNILAKTEGLGLELRTAQESGLLHLQQVDPAELSPGQFAYSIRKHVETHHVSMVVIDSLNGYVLSMPDERLLLVQLHELLSYLGQNGVTSFLILNQEGFFGEKALVPVSYLADNVILLRYFEAKGEIHRAISVIKMRCCSHESTIRELHFGPKIKIGQPLKQFEGVLTGTPKFVGHSEHLMDEDGKTL